MIPRRKLVESKPFLDSLLERPEVRERIKKAIVLIERPPDFVDSCILRKRAHHATYDMIDAYRDLFLIKHPGRTTMSSSTKKMIMYLYANVMVCGDKWAEGDELEEMRLRASTTAAQAARKAVGTERANIVPEEDRETSPPEPDMPDVYEGNERQRAAIDDRNKELDRQAAAGDGGEVLTAFVRLPAVPEKMGSRPLPDAVWGTMDVISCACLCVLDRASWTAMQKDTPRKVPWTSISIPC